MTDHDAACGHLRGDYVPEIAPWVCADCLKKLDARPTKYGLNPYIVTGGEYGCPRQVIVWQAKIAEADGVRFGDFLRAMSRRYMMRTRPTMAVADAYAAAIEFLKCLSPDKYGDPAYGWDRACAWDFADEDMSYWEDAGGNT